MKPFIIGAGISLFCWLLGYLAGHTVATLNDRHLVDSLDVDPPEINNAPIQPLNPPS